MAVNRHEFEEAPSGSIDARQRRQMAVEYGNLALSAPATGGKAPLFSIGMGLNNSSQNIDEWLYPMMRHHG